MAGVNKVILVGNLGKDPEVALASTTAARSSTCSVATSENWKDRDGKRKEQTEWHNVVDLQRKPRRGSPSNICARARRSISKASSRPANGRTSRATTAIRPRSCCSSFRGALVLLDSRGERRRRRGDFGGGDDDFGGGSGGGGPRRQSRPQPAAFDTDLDDDVPF